MNGRPACATDWVLVSKKPRDKINNKCKTYLGLSFYLFSFLPQNWLLNPEPCANRQELFLSPVSEQWSVLLFVCLFFIFTLLVLNWDFFLFETGCHVSRVGHMWPGVTWSTRSFLLQLLSAGIIDVVLGTEPIIFIYAIYNLIPYGIL